jgi:hypothetical protein
MPNASPPTGDQSGSARVAAHGCPTNDERRLDPPSAIRESARRSWPRLPPHGQPRAASFGSTADPGRSPCTAGSVAAMAVATPRRSPEASSAYLPHGRGLAGALRVARCRSPRQLRGLMRRSLTIGDETSHAFVTAPNANSAAAVGCDHGTGPGTPPAEDLVLRQAERWPKRRLLTATSGRSGMALDVARQIKDPTFGEDL